MSHRLERTTATPPWGGYTPTAAELSVAGYIEEASCEDDFLPILEKDPRTGVQRHLSPMRRALLSWYPFAPDARVLEWGAGMGALTGVLCDSCGEVVAVEENEFYRAALQKRFHKAKNLTVIANLSGLPATTGEGFDTVVAVMPPALDAALLHTLRSHLAPQGRLLLAVPNRFALRSLCGGEVPGGASPFAGVAGETGTLYGRQALAGLLAAAGFTTPHCTWYYPMRDCFFPQEVFSDAHLPTPEGNSRYYPAMGQSLGAVLSEDALLPELVAEGAFPLMANAFLVECRMDAHTPPCPAQYAAVTEGRPPEGRFATVVGEDTVTKKALHSQGKERLAQMAQNDGALRKRGLSVVSGTLTGSTLRMPRLPGETLWNSWNRQSREGTFDKDRFLTLLDRIVAAIKASSDTDAPGSHGWPPALGPVQHTAYVELVPANCFYDEAADTLTFFDQEFAREHCPVTVPLYRAIANACNCAASRPLLEELKEKYGLAAIWDALHEEEIRFEASIFGTTREGLMGHWQPAANFDENRRTLALRGLATQLRHRGWHTVALYGYGPLGQELAPVLPGFGVAVAYVMDKNADKITAGQGTPQMCLPTDMPDTPVDGVLVTLRKTGEAVAAQLRQQLLCPVLTLQDLMDE